MARTIGAGVLITTMWIGWLGLKKVAAQAPDHDAQAIPWPPELPPEYAPPDFEGSDAQGEWDNAVPAAPPIPQHAEGPAVQGAGGGYCYVGSHPSDPNRAAGPAWHEDVGEHTHFYPPIDLRLFVLQGHCYHFVGDPVDFGYTGSTFQYYGAHPVPMAVGQWCFMIGGHRHVFRPWSQNFVVAGPFFYWQGAYDAHFWSYWPYYVHFYRDHYPRYYAGGRFHRQRGAHRAPPITQVPIRQRAVGRMPPPAAFPPGPPNRARPAPAPTPGWPSRGPTPHNPAAARGTPPAHVRPPGPRVVTPPTAVPGHPTNRGVHRPAPPVRPAGRTGVMAPRR